MSVRHAQRGIGLVPLLLIVLLLVGLCVVGGYAGFQVSQKLLAHLTLENQDMKVMLPERLQVTADVSNIASIGLDGYINTTVPFSEDVVVPFVGEYDVDIEIDTQIPVNFEVIYEGVIPVDTMAAIMAKTEIDFGNVKKLRNLEIQTEIPMQFDLPVSLRVPVNQSIRFYYKGPIVVYADEELNVHIETEFPVSLLVQQTINTPIRSAIILDAEVPRELVNVTITEAELDLRVSTLRLETK